MSSISIFILYLVYSSDCIQLLGRMIDLRSLIAERMNRVFRDNIEFLYDRFESQDLCAIVVSSLTVSLCSLILY